MSAHRILLVDDEPAQRTVLSGFFKKRGYEVTLAANVASAREQLAREGFDLVITDMRMPDGTGLDLLDTIRHDAPDTAVVVMTAFGTVANAVEAMKRGAVDYVTKPIDLDEIEVIATRALERRALVSENRELKHQLESRYRFQGLDTQNARMAEAINTAARAAASKATILIRGESGTGKEVLARAIHFASPRATKAFVAVNVAALPDTLIESELFGHERGAFTGADREVRGRFEQADGGTLLLDEIGDLPKQAQVKLLRVLQEHRVERLGSSRGINIDVRVIAATNRDLEAMVRSGEFREDLFYRLDVVTIHVPALRDRREDIPSLVEVFLQRFATERPGQPLACSREALDVLVRAPWPGNVRELENTIHRAVVLARGPLLTTNDLPAHVRGLSSERRPGAEAAGAGDDPSLPFIDRVAAFESRLIDQAMSEADGVQTRAARALGMSERHLRYKLQKRK
ncbi:MAG: sigma-54-dependent Fis family transcriptional regulator [Acidobacteria bacterium]|nr:sigma-54-dependent Fis family transcriptional regulator [Acidobacteriota bacterium]